jgi:hypothetical protein
MLVVPPPSLWNGFHVKNEFICVLDQFFSSRLVTSGIKVIVSPIPHARGLCHRAHEDDDEV